MKKKKIFTVSIIGVIICSILIGYSNKNENIETISNEEYMDNMNFTRENREVVEADDYWENTSMDEIRKSILGYIDEMMESTLVKLEDFKKENNEKKINLYENEVERLNIILEKVKVAENKEDLRNAMQVRYKSNV